MTDYMFAEGSVKCLLSVAFRSSCPECVFAFCVRCMNQVKAVIPEEEEIKKNRWLFFP